MAQSVKQGVEQAVDLADTAQDGFEHERIMVLPRPLVRDSLKNADGGDLITTDIGYFPAASRHHVARPQGCPEWVLIYCVKGSGAANINGIRVQVRTGDALFLPPNVTHSYHADSTKPWTIYWLHAAGRRATAICERLTQQSANWVLPVESQAELPALFLDIEGKLRRLPSSDALLEMSLATGSLFGRLLEIQRRQHLCEATHLQARLTPAVRYMQNALHATVTVAEMAQLAQLSPSHFTAMFRRQMGCPPLKYFLRLKMQKAAELLDRTQMPVNTIASNLGYADPMYFSRAFRQEHGMPPTAYRGLRKG